MPSQIAKISRPSLQNVLERKETLARLESALQSPLVWVTGPPGSGKTTLVSDYIRSRKKKCLWYQVDERDVDPGSFFHYMGLAVRKALPKTQNTIPCFSPEYLSGLMVFAIIFFEEVFKQLRKGSLLVFDNYQIVHDDSQLNSLIKKGLSVIPRDRNVIIISRQSPPKEFSWFLASNKMTVLQWDDLKLSIDETRDILALRSKYQYSEKEIQHLHDITEGWVSGLTLWTQARQLSSPVFIKDSYDTPEAVFDYFASEIFSNTSPEIQHFLMTTSFLPKMNIPMADEIAGTTNARKILLRLVRQQYFILKYGRLDKFYTYHQLFRSFLQRRAKETLSLTELNHYRQKAARLLMENGDIDEAAKLLVECQAFDELAKLIATHALTLIGHGRHAFVIELLNRLPDIYFKKNIWLLFWRGVAQLVINPKLSYRNFETIFHIFSKSGDLTGKLLSWAGIIDATSLQFCGFKEFDKWIREFEQIKDAYLRIHDKHIKYRVASCFFKALVLRQPHHPDIEHWAKEALKMGNINKELDVLSWTYLRLQFYYFAIKTDFRKVSELSAQLKEIVTAHPSTSPMATINVFYTEMFALQMQGHLQESLAVIDDYRAFAEKSGIHMFDFFFFIHEASLYLDQNNIENGARILGQMQGHQDAMNLWVKSLYYCQRARIGIMEQNDAYIKDDINKAIELAEAVGCHYTILICMLQKVYVHQVMGQKTEAQILLNHYFKRIKSRESDQDQFMGFLTQAHLFFESGKDIKGIAALRHGLAFGKKHGLLFSFSDQPTVTAKLCVKALSENIEVPYVQRIIRKRNFYSEHPPLHLENWPWPVKIQSFGNFEICLNGNPIYFSRKTPKKIFLLLKAIIAYPNDTVPIIWLMDNLWPDADGDRAMEALKVSVKRLRSMLGDPQTVQWKKSTLRLDPKLVWIDLVAFESINRELNLQANHPDDNKINSAITLIKGPFLDGDDSLPVFITRRSEFEVLFANFFQSAFTHDISINDLPQIITTMNKAVTHPDLYQAIRKQIISRVAKKR